MTFSKIHTHTLVYQPRHRVIGYILSSLDDIVLHCRWLQDCSSSGLRCTVLKRSCSSMSWRRYLMWWSLWSLLKWCSRSLNRYQSVSPHNTFKLEPPLILLIFILSLPLPSLSPSLPPSLPLSLPPSSSSLPPSLPPSSHMYVTHYIV